MSLQCFYKLGVIAYFNLNHEYIAKTLCVNKDLPMTTCHGKCFLNRNLKTGEERSTKETGMPTVNEVVDFSGFVVPDIDYCFHAGSKDAEPGFHYFMAVSQGNLNALLRPPA